MSVEILRPDEADLATGVLCDAFHDYPVMRHVLGAPADYDRRLEILIGFFVAARVIRQDLMLGVRGPDRSLVAVALLTLPRDLPLPDALALRREATWRLLGTEPRTRYEAFGAAAAEALRVDAPHHHLNMIGVRPAHRGAGHGRVLLERVHAIAAEDPASAGVSLTTELESNVALYERFGYRILGRARTSDGLQTWAMFRPGTP